MLAVNYSFVIGHFFIFCLVIDISHQVALRGENVRDAGANEFRTVVSLGTKNRDQTWKHFCTGTLISEKHVLTAAHCLAGLYPISVELSIGSVDYGQGTKYQPSYWMTYKDWKYPIAKYAYDSRVHDIAIITLTSSVTDIKPAKLSKLTSEELIGSVVKIAGWGITNNDVRPATLKTALLKILSNENCNGQLSQLTNNVVSIEGNSICSKAESWILSDDGDSGGPSFDKDNGLVGVTVGRCPHHDYFCNPADISEKNQFVLHMSINYYRDFIKSVTKE